MRPSNMVVKIKKAGDNASSNEAVKRIDGNSLTGMVYPVPLKLSVGDVALQKIKKYEEKYLKASSTSVQHDTSLSEESDIQSVPQEISQSDKTPNNPNFVSGWLGNIKFANFSDSESASEIPSVLSSVKVATSTEIIANEGLLLGKDIGGKECRSPLTETEVDNEPLSVSNYLEGSVLPIENLKLDESNEDKYKEVETLSNHSKTSSTGKWKKLSSAHSDNSQEKTASYSDNFEDMAEKSGTEINTDSEDYLVDLSRARRAEPKVRRRSQNGKKTLNSSQAGSKLETKSTQTVFKNVSKTPLHSFLSPLPSTSDPKEDYYNMEPFLFSNFNVAVNIEGMAHSDISREVLRQQIALTKHYISCQRSMYQSYCQSLERLTAHYKPVTLKDTETLIRKHRHSRHKKSIHSERKTGGK